jgi:hypothetical protein
MKMGREEGKRAPRTGGPLRGIVITRGSANVPRQPTISAFIWGGKVRPAPTLPYGRWKGAA